MVYIRRIKKACTVLLLICAGVLASKDESEKTPYIPDALQQWKQWVLEKHPKISCPDIANNTVPKQCVWQSELNLQISEKNAQFTITAKVFADDFVGLPGDSTFWPYDVSANGKTVPVFMRNGIPSIDLQEGSWKITGMLKWDNRPNSIKIPPSTALINVICENKKITNLSLDQDGMLWLKEINAESKDDSTKTENVQVKVYRKIIDAVPIYMITMLRLSVSGRERELHLGRFLPENSIPVYLHSTLPATIENNGNLMVQVKSGTWIVEMKSRFTKEVSALKMEQKTKEWPSQEIWCFEADNRLRTVSISGVSAIDPEQTGIPADWTRLQTFLVGKEDSFEIVQEHRGDFSPDPDVLQLEREMWLDFKGSSFTVKDQISGSVSRPGRLSMDGNYTIGSVQLGGVPQLVTTVDDADPGIEYQQGTMNLECLSTFEKNRRLSNGWNHEFSSVSAFLHLPPGWTVFHLSGADYVDGSWISRWNVWDLFIMLIFVITVAKLFSFKWGLLSAIVFAITFHEKGAPLFLWLNIVAAIALLRVLPDCKFKKVMAFYTMLSFMVICITGIAFGVIQVRQALYPQLEWSGTDMGSSQPVDFYEKMPEEKAAKSVLKAEFVTAKELSGSFRNRNYKTMSQNLDIYDADAKIQTGPGKPAWRWNSVSYAWNGPVEKSQNVWIVFVSPAVNSVLSIIKVIGLFWLLLLFGKEISKWKSVKKTRSSLFNKGSGIFTVCCLMFLFPANLRADIPSAEILSDLEHRLTRDSVCRVDCVSIQKGKLKIDDGTVTIELYIDAKKNAACQLPGNRHSWFPEKITLNDDGMPPLSGTVDGGIIAALPKGHNKIVLSGHLTNTGSEIQFPVAVHNLVAESDNWKLSGIVGGRIPGGVVKVEKVEKSANPVLQKNISVLSDKALPFIEVTRKLKIDKEWTIETVVRRIAPECDPVSLLIPLLQNESVISSAISDPVGFITIYMTRDQQEFSWHSTLKISPEVVLEVPKQDSWSEIWMLEQSPRWHIETSGIAQIKQDVNVNGSVQTWYPLPGEKVVLKIQKPEPVTGPTMTIQNVVVNCTPGWKKSDNSVNMTVLSSQADRLILRLQSESQLEHVSVDGVSQIISMSNDKLNVPIHPGTQSVSVRWKAKNNLDFITKTPFIGCENSCTNISINCDVPQERWLFFCGGPVVGPAVLFWPILVVLLIISIGLGKINGLPVRWYHWLLLSAGMSTVDNVAGVFVVLWFLLLAARRKVTMENKHFNLWQTGCILLTIAAVGSIIATIPMGLLNNPDMLISGNHSSRYDLKWFQDMSGSLLPQGWFISIPVWVYRVTMLFWSLWAALCLTKWTSWGWSSFSSNGLWKKKAAKTVVK